MGVRLSLSTCGAFRACITSQASRATSPAPSHLPPVNHTSERLLRNPLAFCSAAGNITESAPQPQPQRNPNLPGKSPSSTSSLRHLGLGMPRLQWFSRGKVSWQSSSSFLHHCRHLCPLPEPMGTGRDGADFSQGDAGKRIRFCGGQNKVTASHHWDGERSGAGVKLVVGKRAWS